jgi:hypothetical protein
VKTAIAAATAAIIGAIGVGAVGLFSGGARAQDLDDHERPLASPQTVPPGQNNSPADPHVNPTQQSQSNLTTQQAPKSSSPSQPRTQGPQNPQRGASSQTDGALPVPTTRHVRPDGATTEGSRPGSMTDRVPGQRTLGEAREDRRQHPLPDEERPRPAADQKVTHPHEIVKPTDSPAADKSALRDQADSQRRPLPDEPHKKLNRQDRAERPHSVVSPGSHPLVTDKQSQSTKPALPDEPRPRAQQMAGVERPHQVLTPHVDPNERSSTSLVPNQGVSDPDHPPRPDEPHTSPGGLRPASPGFQPTTHPGGVVPGHGTVPNPRNGAALPNPSDKAALPNPSTGPAPSVMPNPSTGPAPSAMPNPSTGPDRSAPTPVEHSAPPRAEGGGEPKGGPGH